MRWILARAGRERLAQLAATPTLYAFDFDGTLSPIVERADRARLSARTRKLLARLAVRRPCIAISGRSLADLTPRFAGIDVKLLVGNHGAEWPDARPARPSAGVRAWRVRLEQRLPGAEGVHIEDKGTSLAVHWRAAPDHVAAERRVRAAARGLPGARLVGGKCVLNLVPANAPHKGDALVTACKRLGCRAAFFLGDDVTDEDVFETEPPRGLELVGVRVGRSARSAAEYYVRSQDEVDELLEVLLALSAAGP